jgi:hypothetical protein
MKSAYELLTDAERRRIVDAVKDRVPTDQIAKRFSVSAETVARVATDAGVWNKKVVPAILTKPQRQHLTRLETAGTVNVTSSSYDHKQDFNRQTLRWLARNGYVTLVEAKGKGSPATVTITDAGREVLAKARAADGA